MSVVKKPAVCLAHGLINPFASACDAIMQRTYFTGIPAFLRSHGYRVLQPQVSSMGHVHERASQLREQIAAWDELEPGERIIVIGHSMGGLDTRWMISNLGGDELVSSLVTIASPHYGTCLADTVVDGLNPVEKYYHRLDSIGWSIRALNCLTRSFMREEFNPNCLDSPDVDYVSVTGVTESHKATRMIRPLVNILYREEGINDGLVSVESSKWGRYVGVYELDHIAQINHIPQTLTMYQNLLKEVDHTAAETFAASIDAMNEAAERAYALGEMERQKEGAIMA